MTLSTRHHIELYRCCHRLLDALAASARALETAHQPLLARELRVAGAALVSALRKADHAAAEQVVERLDADLDLAVRCAGPLATHLHASRALAVVRRGLWCPPGRDRAPRVVQVAQVTATSLDEVPA